MSYGKTPDAYVLIKLKEKKIKNKASCEETTGSLVTLEETCTRIEDEVEAAKKVLKEAEKRLASAKKEKTDKEYRMCMLRGEGSTIDNDIEFLEFKMMLKATEQNEKKLVTLAKKNMPKGVYSEPILEKVVKLPEVIVEIIGQYLPISVHNNLLSEDLYRKINNIKNVDVTKNVLRVMRHNSMYLTILSREEARTKILFIDGVVNQTFESDSFLDTNYLRYAKKALYQLVVMAKIGNPVFASKILKTIAVFRSGKFTVNNNRNGGLYREFTEQDLPAEYL